MIELGEIGQDQSEPKHRITSQEIRRRRIAAVLGLLTVLVLMVTFGLGRVTATSPVAARVEMLRFMHDQIELLHAQTVDYATASRIEASAARRDSEARETLRQRCLTAIIIYNTVVIQLDQQTQRARESAGLPRFVLFEYCDGNPDK